MALRDVTQADLPILFEHQREPIANQMAALPARDRDAFMLHWRTNVLGSWTVKKQIIVVDDHVAGTILSWDQLRERLVGYWIGSEYWNRGIASAALMEFVTVQEKRRPLHAHVALGNLGSIRVLEKSGFRRIGDVVRQAEGVEALRMQLGSAAPLLSLRATF
jgi:RimJ/RimL family protein N-acetyltransferase